MSAGMVGMGATSTPSKAGDVGMEQIHLADIAEEPSSEEADRSDPDLALGDVESQESSLTDGPMSDGGSHSSHPSDTEVKLVEPVDEDSLYDTDLEIEDDQPEYHNISHARIYLETCQELGIVPASYFMRHLNDEKLHMPHHGLGPLGAKAMAVPLVSNTKVLIFNLEDNWIEAEGGKYIAEMMKENCYIADLNLADNRLGNEGAGAICEMLQYNSSLEYLNLSGNGFQDSVAPLFAAALLDNNTMKHLNLSHNHLGKLAGEVLGHAIGENETLEHLDISWNLLRGQAGAEIVDGIKVNSRLKSVNISWNGLGNESALAIAECLRNNHVLTELDVSSNRINLEGIGVIAKGLDANEDLKILKIGCNPFGSVGAMLLLNAINNERSTLKVLDLKDVLVEKEFDRQSNEMTELRTELSIRHAGVLSNYIIKGSGKKHKPEADETDVKSENITQEQ